MCVFYKCMCVCQGHLCVRVKVKSVWGSMWMYLRWRHAESSRTCARSGPAFRIITAIFTFNSTSQKLPLSSSIFYSLSSSISHSLFPPSVILLPSLQPSHSLLPIIFHSYLSFPLFLILPLCLLPSNSPTWIMQMHTCRRTHTHSNQSKTRCSACTTPPQLQDTICNHVKHACTWQGDQHTHTFFSSYTHTHRLTHIHLSRNV